MIVTQPRRRISGLVLEDYQAPLSDYLSARAAEGWIRSPTSSLLRAAELAAEQDPAGLLAGEEGAFGAPAALSEDDGGGLSPVLGPDVANERFGRYGLKFTGPVRERVAEIMAERKREEVVRQNIMQRGPGGIGVQAGALALDLLVTAADPLNVAAAFVPVVREARFLQWAQRTGVTRARLARGAVEGAAGAAIVEPIVLGAATLEQADYGLVDSLVNIAFGTALGGGLHAGGGRIVDAVQARQPGRGTLAQRLEAASHDTREAALRVSVGQVMRGRLVDIEAILKADEIFEQAFNSPPPSAPRARALTDAPEPADFEIGPETGQGTAVRFDDYRIRPGDRAWIDAVVAELDATDAGARVFLEADGQGGTPDVIGRKATTPEWFQRANRQAKEAARERKRVKKLNRKRSGDQQIPLPPVPEILTRARVRDVAGKLLQGAPLGRAEADVAREIMAEARGLRSRNAADTAEGRRARQAERDAELDRIAANDAGDGDTALGDLRASRAADARLAEVVEVADLDVARAEAVTAEQDLAATVRALGEAYDTVLAAPVGDTADPSVPVTAEEIGAVLVERGPAIERDGEIVVTGRAIEQMSGSRRGFGVVKIIWRHGDRSNKPDGFRVKREDIQALPEILRDYAPFRVTPDREDGAPASWEYAVDRDGRTLVYVVSRFSRTDNQNRLVTVHVREEGGGPVSGKKAANGSGGGPGSSFTGVSRSGDTAPEPFAQPQGGRDAPPASDNVGTSPFDVEPGADAPGWMRRLLEDGRRLLFERDAEIAQARRLGEAVRAYAFCRRRT